MLEDKLMYLHNAADYLGKARYTLQKWAREGKLIAHRTSTNRHYYYQSELDQYLGKTTKSTNDHRQVVLHTRVLSHGQKDDLKNQIMFLRQFVNTKGIIADEVISDIGSGLNYKRPKWLKLIKNINQNKIKQVYVTYEDRFVRFGFNFFKHKQCCRWHHCEIIVLNNKDTSPDRELVNDLVSIIHVFSYKLYGLRRYKNKIKDDPNLK